MKRMVILMRAISEQLWGIYIVGVNEKKWNV